MPLTFINSIASWILKKRIHQMELFIKYPHDVQQELMCSLIKSAENTVIGKKYDFASIKSYETFAERIPISTYEDLEPLIEQTRKGAQNVFWNTPI
ncbi:MAG: GH3 auxin-responsive promoter family protein, partial [Flavobacteriaceae bacterium]|nr:GH3 auxin-responsive promoter family protein [Flavobacteriaceae bacterium]